MVDHENILTRKFFAQNFLTRKFPELRYYISEGSVSHINCVVCSCTQAILADNSSAVCCSIYFFMIEALEY